MNPTAPFGTDLGILPASPTQAELALRERAIASKRAVAYVAQTRLQALVHASYEAAVQVLNIQITELKKDLEKKPTASASDILTAVVATALAAPTIGLAGDLIKKALTAAVKDAFEFKTDEPD